MKPPPCRPPVTRPRRGTPTLAEAPAADLVDERDEIETYLAPRPLKNRRWAAADLDRVVALLPVDPFTLPVLTAVLDQLGGLAGRGGHHTSVAGTVRSRLLREGRIVLVERLGPKRARYRKVPTP